MEEKCPGHWKYHLGKLKDGIENPVSKAWKFQFFEVELVSNERFVRFAVEYNAYVYEFLKECFRDEQEICLSAVKRVPEMMKFASKRLKSVQSKDFLLSVAEKRPEVLEYVSDEFKSCKELMEIAVKSNSRCMKSASLDLKADEEFVLSVVGESPLCLYHLDKKTSFFLEDLSFWEKTLRKDGLALACGDSKIRGDNDLVKIALESNIGCLPYANIQPQQLGILTRSIDYTRKRQITRRLNFQPVHIFPGDGTEPQEHEKFVRENQVKKGFGNIRKTLEGERNLDKFKFVFPIGSGVCGMVFLDTFPGIQENLALKFYKEEGIVSKTKLEEMIRRDLRAYFCEEFYHPNVSGVVCVLENVVIDPKKIHACYNNNGQKKDGSHVVDTHFGSEPFVGTVLVMMYHGWSLRNIVKERIKENRFFDERELLGIILSLAEGLAYLKAKGIVHRDLHPGNILVNPEVCGVWITDFGRSLYITDVEKKKTMKVKHRKSVSEKRDSGVSGTTSAPSVSTEEVIPGKNKGGNSSYLPPEVVIDDKNLIDYSKCDVFSLGKLIEYMLKNVSEGMKVKYMTKFVKNSTEGDLSKRWKIEELVEEVRKEVSLVFGKKSDKI